MRPRTAAPPAAAVAAVAAAAADPGKAAKTAKTASAGSAGSALHPQRLSDRLADRLTDWIEQGALQPGDRLPTEAALAAEHGVSRSVVREAVQRIKSRGLLVSRQGSGVFVARPAGQQPLAFDTSVLDSIDAVLHVVELRRVMEGEIAALAAERAGRAGVARLRRALRAMDDATAAGLDGLAED
ncbi:MAG: FadR/GntR family transcriptional regulator, partial [Aquabacterium sp.]